jgi:hypothetical protein
VQVASVVPVHVLQDATLAVPLMSLHGVATSVAM